jgi:cation transport protein ChaC
VTGVYVPFTLPVCLDDGRKVPALAFVAKRDHVQYFPPGDPEHAARLIRQGVGKAGTARDYLACTLEQMEALGIGSGALHRLLKLVEG